MSSSLLSPIMSSGDSTPPTQLDEDETLFACSSNEVQNSMIKQNGQQNQAIKLSLKLDHQNNNHHHIESTSVNPFNQTTSRPISSSSVVDLMVSPSEIVNKLRLNKLKSQQQHQVKRQKTASNLSGNKHRELSSPNSLSSASSSESINGAHLLNEHRLVANGLANEQSDLNDSQKFKDELATKTTTTKATKMGANQRNRSAFKSTQRATLADNTNKTNNNQLQQNYKTLADQYLKATIITTTTAKTSTTAAAAAANRNNLDETSHENYSTNCRDNELNLNYDDNNYNNSGSNKKSYITKLLASFVPSSTTSLSSNKANGSGLNIKSFKQIIQSLPVAPTLVATTSIMTVVLILCILLLSDTPRATASSSEGHLLSAGQQLALTGDELFQSSSSSSGNQNQQQVNEPAIPAGLHQDQMQSTGSEWSHNGGGGGGGRERQTKSLVRGGDSTDMSLDSIEPSRNALRRELIKDLFLAQASDQQLPPHRAQIHRRHEALGKVSNPTAQSHLFHSNPSSKRNSAINKREFEAPTPQRPAPEEVNLFDSLGSMLFGADQAAAVTARKDEEQLDGGPERAPDDTLRLVSEPAPDGGPSLGGKQSRQVTISAGSHKPAHLRSSALELDLSPEQASLLRNLAASPSSPNARSNFVHQHQHHNHRQPQLQQQQQQQHHTNGSPQQQNVDEQTEASNTQHADGFNHHERPFDVAQVQCNNTDEGFERFACPTPDYYGRYRCIEDRLFCDGYNDCPGGEDEDRVHCMYYRLFVSHIDILTNTFLTWMKSQNRLAARDSIHQQVNPTAQQQYISNGLSQDT